MTFSRKAAAGWGHNFSRMWLAKGELVARK